MRAAAANAPTPQPATSITQTGLPAVESEATQRRKKGGTMAWEDLLPQQNLPEKKPRLNAWLQGQQNSRRSTRTETDVRRLSATELILSP
jgi:hypothetical protein